MQPRPIVTDKSFRPQLHYFVLLLVWVLCIGTFALYASFVMQSSWRPSRWWWLLTTAAVAMASLFAASLVVKRFWHKSQQAWASAIFMLSVWPVVVFLCFVWLVVVTANARGDLKLNLTVRTFGFWVSNYFEWETAYRYPRITSGEFVELHDAGNTPNASQLVELMDQYVGSMSRVLGGAPPNTKIGWVRGQVFGQTGRAVGAWALCKPVAEVEGINRLDRHEVAHTVITTLASGLQDPPMLLAEGWAQSQSESHDRLLSQLRLARRQGYSFSIMQLVSDEFYGRSIAPNYSHGGPLAIYLLQRFGGPKFFELYTGVHRPTFLTDAQRILGVSWQQIEEGFWQWLDSVPPPAGSPLAVKFANEDLQQQWAKIEEKVRQYESQQQNQSLQQADNIGFRFLFDDGNYEVSVVAEDGQAWMVTEYTDRPDQSVTLALRTNSLGEAYIEQLPENGGFEGQPRMEVGDTTIHSLLSNALNHAKPKSLRNQFSISLLGWSLVENSSTVITIQSVETGEKPGDPWRVKLIESWGLDDDSQSEAELLLDPTQGFRVDQVTTKFANGDTLVQQHQHGMLEGRAVAKKTESARTNLDGIVAREVSSQLQALSPNEVAQVKARVESAVKQSREQVKIDWNSRLLNPYSVAFGWLAIAGLILAIDFVGNRWKFPVVAASRNNST